ncbi:nitroreductase family deazaflavin-dependent oxidoreductase [Dactylosporangium sp. AC04546]|uniref:hypothetical protein n=1 Tax=Dactylosporangium sp. AC04546 TaxID=2862460 RepID=UPI001EDCEAA6|nr:hypothetical protein [Dactylosporangium sp. AC04546]WVK88683.1 nitroreductase family deazaflavin-dependent oxidoreductase [Dactylosporangium sp. AC04546]
MPLPRWLARINRRYLNPAELRRGVRPVLTHVGRTSGRTYRTPLDAHALPDGGYLFVPLYGPRTDWVRNVLAAGTATLTIDGAEVHLESPRLVRKHDVQPPLARLRASGNAELLRMDRTREP